ncbi:MAG: hypothetical protein VX798_04350 [Bacteroidota bacterium]|nr:hypothetical protein [Bacteroidota bacterium]
MERSIVHVRELPIAFLQMWTILHDSLMNIYQTYGQTIDFMSAN